MECTQNITTATWKLKHATQRVRFAFWFTYHLSVKRLAQGLGPLARFMFYIFILGKCITLNNPDKKWYSSNMPCVDGKWKNGDEEVEGCISDSENPPWCATEVDSTGAWQKYGYCNMNIAACNPGGEVEFLVCLSTLHYL